MNGLVLDRQPRLNYANIWTPTSYYFAVVRSFCSFITGLLIANRITRQTKSLIGCKRHYRV